jgi:hypothetical protein
MKLKPFAILLTGMLLMMETLADTWVDVYVTVKDGNGYSLSGATAKLYGGSSPYGGTPYASQTMWWDTCYLSCYRSTGPVVLTVEKAGYGTWRELWDESELGDYAFFEPVCVLLPPCSVTAGLKTFPVCRSRMWSCVSTGRRRQCYRTSGRHGSDDGTRLRASAWTAIR